jgi:phage major head subunit gpT-like protein
MDINRENLDTVFRGLRSDFNGAFRNGEDATADALATTVPSSTASERFDWLGDLPEMREWLGERVVKQLKTHKYEVFPKEWELTIRAKRSDIMDDRIGIYSLQARSGGEGARLLKVREIANALDAGASELCYDGQPFFDTEHPVGDAGDVSLVSNLLGGGGASAASPWYIADMTRVVKPIICIDREKPAFQAFADYTNLHTFMNNEFLYGTSARLGTGYGLWQTCVRNENALNVDNLMATRYAMSQFTSDTKNEAGRRKKLGINGKVLICGAANEEKALACIKSSIVSSRTDALAVASTTTPNPCLGLFELVVVSWLP